MDQKFKSYSKTCFKKSEVIYKTFYHVVFVAFFEICESFRVKDSREKDSVGGTSKNFHKKWDCNLKQTEMKCRDLLLEEYCSKLFSLMDNFRVEIIDKRVDIC